MAGQKGRSFLLKLGSSGTGGTTVAAMTETGFTINGQPVDNTSKDSAGYRTLLDGAGNASMQITASGKLVGGLHHATLSTRAAAQSLEAYGIVWDNGDTIDGTFQVTSFQADGPDGADQTWSVALESSGSWTAA